MTTNHIPEPPWWRAPHDQERRGRAPLSRDAIVDAALRVLESEGLDALSMRRVAEELGVGAASLYWHLSGKEQLIALVLDRVIGEVPLPEPDPERWEEQLKEFARNGRAAFRRYRDLARAIFGRIPIGPNAMCAIEWQLELCRRAGIAPRLAAWFGDLFGLFLGGYALEDELAADATVTDQSEMLPMMVEYLASLPPERFPAITALREDLMSGGPDERFEFGLDLLLKGLAAMSQEASTADRVRTRASGRSPSAATPRPRRRR